MLERPTVSDDLLEINADLDVNYGVFKNELTFVRPSNAWRLWPKLSFVEPAANQIIVDMFSAGVRWNMAEHVSVCVNGYAEHVYEGPDGPVANIWQYGHHNVENGGGYLPLDSFSRTFHDDYTLCCILQRRDRAPGVTYQFEVVKAPKVLQRDVLFAHYATGTRQKQTDYDLKAGDMVEVATPDDIVILGWTV